MTRAEVPGPVPDRPRAPARTLRFDDLAPEGGPAPLSEPPTQAPRPRDVPSPEAVATRTVGFDDLSPAAEPAPTTALPPRPRPRPTRSALTVPAGDRQDDGSASRVAPGRALAGAALSVCGVVLGITVLLWITDDPGSVADGLGTAPSSQDSRSGSLPSAAASPTPPVSAAASSGTARPGGVPPVPPTEAAAAPVTPPVVPVTVLNNSRRSGLAARAAARFQTGGWPVAVTGNFRGRIPVTTVYYDPGLQASAQAFADTFDGIVRVRPRFSGLPARGVVVVVTREFAV